MSDSSSRSGSDPRLSPHSRSFQARNLEAAVDAYIATNPGPFTALTKSILRGLSHIDLRAFIRRVIDTIKDEDFRREIYEASKGWIKAHPWHVAFFVIAIVLMINPLALAGFGALGPVAGSLAAAWQASIGSAVAAGSLFALLQSMGMTLPIVIPAVGAGLFGSTFFAAIAERVRGPGT
ncbi:hypothetical protein BZA77DRAFT_371527 [Pyronema omphalodes]|nr:hypothetical protein BZA77DRAFT_371527 [Pyronema omphalodes]